MAWSFHGGFSRLLLLFRILQFSRSTLLENSRAKPCWPLYCIVVRRTVMLSPLMPRPVPLVFSMTLSDSVVPLPILAAALASCRPLATPVTCSPWISRFDPPEKTVPLCPLPTVELLANHIWIGAVLVPLHGTLILLQSPVSNTSSPALGAMDESDCPALNVNSHSPSAGEPERGSTGPVVPQSLERILKSMQAARPFPFMSPDQIRT